MGRIAFGAQPKSTVHAGRKLTKRAYDLLSFAAEPILPIR